MNNLLKYKDYLAKIEYDSEEKILFGVIQGISDLVTFESASIEDIEDEFHSAVDDYLETCKELGKLPEKTYKGSFNVRIDPERHKKADRLAFQSNITLNKFVEEAIQEKISRMEYENSKIEEVKNKVDELGYKIDSIKMGTTVLYRSQVAYDTKIVSAKKS